MIKKPTFSIDEHELIVEEISEFRPKINFLYSFHYGSHAEWNPKIAETDMEELGKKLEKIPGLWGFILYKDIRKLGFHLHVFGYLQPVAGESFQITNKKACKKIERSWKKIVEKRDKKTKATFHHSFWREPIKGSPLFTTLGYISSGIDLSKRIKLGEKLTWNKSKLLEGIEFGRYYIFLEKTDKVIKRKNWKSILVPCNLKFGTVVEMAVESKCQNLKSWVKSISKFAFEKPYFFAIVKEGTIKLFLPYLPEASLKLMEKYGELLWKKLNKKHSKVDCYYSQIKSFEDRETMREGIFLKREMGGFGVKEIFWKNTYKDPNTLSLEKQVNKFFKLSGEVLKNRSNKTPGFRKILNCIKQLRLSESHFFELEVEKSSISSIGRSLRMLHFKSKKSCWFFVQENEGLAGLTKAGRIIRKFDAGIKLRKINKTSEALTSMVVTSTMLPRKSKKWDWNFFKVQIS